MDTKAAEFAQKLGARIVSLRKEHNYAQERLATLARMNKGYLSSVESGQRVPSVGMLMKLAKVLEVSVFELFVFPEQGAAERLWEEIRLGQTSQAEQLRQRHGLGAALVPAGQEPAARPAIGATATVLLPGRTPTAMVDGGSGHSGKRSPAIHFGLGPQPPELIPVELKVRDLQGRVCTQTLHLPPGWHTVYVSCPPPKEGR